MPQLTIIIYSCVVVNGELLAVRGYDKDDKPSGAVHKYNPTTNYNSWNLTSNMQAARWQSLIAVLPTNEMIVVGGHASWMDPLLYYS